MTFTHKEHHISLFNSKLSLARHRLYNPFGFNRFKATRIDHNIGEWTHATLAILAVTGQTWKIGHDGIARAS